MGFSEGGISAVTGFQSKFLDKDFLINEFSKIIEDPNKENVFDYIQTSLRSASDVYRHGGNVLLKYKDRRYALEFDNKRRIIEESSGNFLDSQP